MYKRWTVLALFVVLLVGLVGCGSIQSGTDSGQGSGTDSGQGSNSQSDSVQEQQGLSSIDDHDLDALIEAAKTEGEVTVYSSSSEVIAQEHAKAFEERYGIKVNLYRAGGAQVQQRVETELLANSLQVDVLVLSDSSYHYNLSSRGALLEYSPPEVLELGEQFHHGDWTANYLLLFPIMYNTNEVSEAEAPKTYLELIEDPKWKGKLVTASPLYGSSQTALIVGLMELYGDDIIQKLADQDVMVQQAFPAAQNAVIAGERLVGVTISARWVQDAEKGQPLGVVWPEEGVLMSPGAIGILKDAPNMNAAKLYYRWSFGDEAMNIASDRHTVTGHKPALLPPLEDLNLIPVEPDVIAEKTEIMREMWSELLGD